MHKLQSCVIAGVVMAGLACATSAPGLTLKPSIGLPARPDTSEKICSVGVTPVWSSFDKSGFKVGDTIPDFTLYTPDGTAINAATVLKKGKPMLLVAGSYTCGTFRTQLGKLNAINAAHGSDVSIYIVYVLEAHPIVDNSPYSGALWVTDENYADSVLYRQPTSYGERLKIAWSMQSRMTVMPKVILDGPCNQWWNTFGPAPNNAYLIDTTGRVYSKHGWFDSPPRDMEADIDSLLKGVAPVTAGAADHGWFGVSPITDAAEGTVGQTIIDSVKLINPSSFPTTVTIVRRAGKHPAGWTTSMCTDVCYGTAVDSVELYLSPGDASIFSLDFMTTGTPGSGTETIDFINADSAANTISRTLGAASYPVVSLKPSIGLSAAPAASSAICSIPQVASSFDAAGFKVGDTIPDFTLYAPDGTPVSAAGVLARHKPMLFVAGSYSSPEFRAQVSALNTIFNVHANDVSIYVVYVAEPHPVVDNSPYSGTEWVPGQNYIDSVLYRQPKVYGERVGIASAMLARMTIQPPVILDGPCNAWWSTFGPAPNNAYLIDLAGRVYAKHGWFNAQPHDMMADIDSLLAGAPPRYDATGGTGTVHGIVAFAADADTVRGNAGKVFSTGGTLTNPSPNPVAVRITRRVNAIPAGWTSSLGGDAWYPPTQDVIYQYLRPREVKHFVLDFSSAETPGSGTVTIDIVNADSTVNAFSHTYHAVTTVQGMHLKPSIGADALPDAADRICPITRAPTPYAPYTPATSPGLAVGDTIPDFTLYAVDGTPVNAGAVLARRKPMVLIAGSYTSPEFRAQAHALNALDAAYGSRVSIYVVYVVEPHPVIDTSPYSGAPWVPSQNYLDTVLYRQPTTYGERRTMVATMLSRLTIRPRVILDGPCNRWWETFGPAPNNAYLIDTGGLVYAKHGWFDRAPRDMSADIDSLFKGVPRGYDAGEENVARHGIVAFIAEADTVHGIAGTVFAAGGRISNPSPNPVTVTIIRRANALPSGWTSAMGTEVLCGPAIDSTRAYLAAGATLDFTLDFNTAATPGTGTVTIDFSNTDSVANTVSHTFAAVADAEPSGVAGSGAALPTGVSIFPQPVRRGEAMRVELQGTSPARFTVVDLLGRTRFSAPVPAYGAITVPTDDLPRGVYLYWMQTDVGAMESGTMVVE